MELVFFETWEPNVGQFVGAGARIESAAHVYTVRGCCSEGCHESAVALDNNYAEEIEDARTMVRQAFERTHPPKIPTETHPYDMTPDEFFRLPIVPWPEGALMLTSLRSRDDPTGFTRAGEVWRPVQRDDGSWARTQS